MNDGIVESDVQVVHPGQISQLRRNASRQAIYIDLETDQAGQVPELRWNLTRQLIIVHQAACTMPIPRQLEKIYNLDTIYQ